MPWFKVDDGFHGHPKIIDLSLGAVGLWTLAGSWCANYLTDGRITEKSIFRLGGTKAQAQELVEAGLWIPLDDGYEFKDWHEFQPTREQVLADRKATADRVAAYRERKKQERNAGRNGVTNAERNGGSTPVVQAPRPDPTRPDPDPVVTDVTTGSSSSSDADAPDGAFPAIVQELCESLAQHIEANGSKKPKITKPWLQAADRMIRIDGIEAIRIARAIEWCQNDEFWRANILSMPTLRAKFDQIRLAAQRPKTGVRRPNGADVLSQARPLVEQLWREEQEQETRNELEA